MPGLNVELLFTLRFAPFLVPANASFRPAVIGMVIFVSAMVVIEKFMRHKRLVCDIGPSYHRRRGPGARIQLGADALVSHGRDVKIVKKVAGRAFAPAAWGANGSLLKAASTVRRIIIGNNKLRIVIGLAYRVQDSGVGQNSDSGFGEWMTPGCWAVRNRKRYH